MRKIQLILLLVLCGAQLLWAQTPPPPGPSLVYTLGRDSICHGDTTQLVVMDTTLHGTVHISWSPSTGLSCDTCDTVRAYPTVTTSYTLIAHDSLKSDTGIVIITVDTLVAGVNVFIVADTSFQPFDTSLYYAHTFCPYTIIGKTTFTLAGNLLVAFPINGGTNPVYQWQLNGLNSGISSDTFNMNLLADSIADSLTRYRYSSPYYCLLTCQMTSSITSCIQNRTVVSFADTLTRDCGEAGINPVSIINEVKISPNPGNGIFSLSVSQPSKQMTIELWNVQGQLLYAEQKQWESAFTKQYNFSDLAKGVYLLKVSTESGVIVKRVIIQ